MNRKKLRSLYIRATGPVTFFRYFNRAIAVSKDDSYFPEMKRKPLVKREIENLCWLAKYHEVNDFYNLYGFDIEDFRKQDEYIDYYSFMVSRNDANRIDCPESQTCILRDKLLFYEFMEFNGFPVPKVFAIIENGNVCDLKHNILGDDFLKSRTNYFIKDLGGGMRFFCEAYSQL